MSTQSRTVTSENPTPPPSGNGIVKVVSASLIGTAVEWYDFFLYGSAAALVFGALFFPDAIVVKGLPAHAGALARTLAAVIDHGITLVVGHVLALAGIVVRVATAPTR